MRTIGDPSCSKFLNGLADDATESLEDAAWLAGCITAYNTLTGQTYDILGASDLDGAVLWMKNYCNAYPLERLSRGMESLVEELRPNRTVTRPLR